MEIIAIIHICADSVRMIQIKLNRDNAYTLIEKYREPIDIFGKLDSNGNILSDAISSLITILKNFQSICEAKKVDRFIIIGTETLRSVSNSNIVVDLIKKKVGIPIELISEEQQCYYDMLSTSAFVEHPNGLIFDLSAGSFQLIHMKHRTMESFYSFPEGAIQLGRIFRDNSLSKEEKEHKINVIADKVIQQVPWLSTLENLPVIAMGRNIRYIARLDMYLRKYPLDIVHGYSTNIDRIEYLYENFNLEVLENWEKNEDIQHDYNILLGSIFFTKTLLQKLSVPSITISGNGLKEGVFYNYLMKEKKIIIRSPLMHSIENIIKLMELDSLHAFQIRWLAMEIFTNIRDVLNLPETKDVDLHQIVNTSALLHDSGSVINYYNHHHHSYWVILNSPICGLTHKELLMSAYIASFHRKNNSYITFDQYSEILTEDDITIIRKLGVILKLAESLDKRMDNVVKNIDFTITDTEIIMEISASIYLDMELRDASRILDEFETIIGKKLVLK